ncbi:MAG: hypothetical protein NTW93_03790 [Phycisphaerae bacterium]|nr:hypothetical protein [Phycisphaerae bacterium]
MRKAISLFILSICLFYLAGCQESIEKEKQEKQGQVVVTPDGKFPRFLAGTWKADKNDWQITFGKNGNISSIVHILWAEKIDLEQGQGYYYIDGPDPNEGTYAYFTIGPCEGSYDSAARQLKVKIIMNEYEIRLPPGSLKGRNEDYFEGKISKDGTKWYADWRSFGYLDEAQLPDINDINANPEKLVFSKIDAK